MVLKQETDVQNIFFDPPAPHPFLTLRGPANTPVSEVCPHCKREIAAHGFDCDGHPIRVMGTCVEHGKVTPIRSAVVNRM